MEQCESYSKAQAVQYLITLNSYCSYVDFALKCGESKTTHLTYLSSACQKADWKEHKRSACVKPPMFHKLDRMMKKYSGPNYPLGQLAVIEKVAWEERRRNPTPVKKCDSCFSRFQGAPIEEDDYDFDSGELLKDAGAVSKRCTECDYTICEDCSKPENQGEF